MYKADEVLARCKALLAAGMPKPEIIRELSKLCIGWPYVFAASGNPCTPDVRRHYADARKDHAEAIRKACPVLSGKQDTCAGCKWDGVLCDDCRGFTRLLLAWVGLQLYGETVSTQWESKSNWVLTGNIADMPKNLVCCVFRTGHTGMYMGNGKVRHCGGKAGCVVEEALPGLPRWLQFGIPAGLYSTEELRKAGVIVDESRNVPTLRRGATGELVKSVQEYLNDTIDAGLDVDGLFGAATEKAVKYFQRVNGLTADGVVGPKTWAAMGGAPDSDEMPDEPIEDGDADEAPEEPEETVRVPRAMLEYIAGALEDLALGIRGYAGGGD